MRKRLRVAAQIARELYRLHRDGTYVECLSPDTVEVGLSGFPEIAHIGSSDVNSPYCAPELREDGLVCLRRADIYSLGCVMFFLLTGREAPVEWTSKHYAMLPDALAMLVARCVGIRPRSRVGNANDIALALDVEADRLRNARADSDAPQKRRSGWHSAPVAAVAGAAALLVLAGTLSTAMGTLGVAAVLVGASISAGESV